MKLDKKVIDIVISNSRKYDIPFELITAIIEIESNGDTNAVRSELSRYVKSSASAYTQAIDSSFRYLVNPGLFATKIGISTLTEEVLQRMSFGLLQVMGYTARSAPLNFEGNLMTLCDPSIGVDLGCRYLAKQMLRYKRDFKKVIASYNAGSARYKDDVFINQRYVDKVYTQYVKNLER
jgi:soluble lytic murein transglycosylase-like protein